jgi:hypothetical protein
MNANPDPGHTLKTTILSKSKYCIMLNFNENKFTINVGIQITLIFILFMPSFLSFSCVFFSSFYLFLYTRIGIRIRNTDPDPCDQLNADPVDLHPDPKHWLRPNKLFKYLPVNIFLFFVVLSTILKFCSF